MDSMQKGNKEMQEKITQLQREKDQVSYLPFHLEMAVTIRAADSIMTPYLNGERGRGHIICGANPIGIGISMTLFLVNQWLDSYQIFMDI